MTQPAFSAVHGANASPAHPCACVAGLCT